MRENADDRKQENRKRPLQKRQRSGSVLPIEPASRTVTRRQTKRQRNRLPLSMGPPELRSGRDIAWKLNKPEWKRTAQQHLKKWSQDRNGGKRPMRNLKILMSRSGIKPSADLWDQMTKPVDNYVDNFTQRSVNSVSKPTRSDDCRSIKTIILHCKSTGYIPFQR